MQGFEAQGRSAFQLPQSSSEFAVLVSARERFDWEEVFDMGGFKEDQSQFAACNSFGMVQFSGAI
jgi:hypothetical protein